jgi:type I restriction enzyme S subunit
MGDILYTKGGTTGVAKVNDLDEEFSVWVHLAVLQIPNDKLSAEYIAMTLNSPHCYMQSQKYTHGVGNKDLGLTRMAKITLPLPPLNEQKRIVQKVAQLIKFCDDIKEQVKENQKNSELLMEAVLREAFQN